MNSRHGLVGLALALSVGAVACGSSEGDQSISGVVPGDVFVGRSAEVLIIGDGTEWSETPSVSFGEGITVDEITVASPTALMVTITADANTTLGTRDVTVDDLAFAGAFELVSPLKMTSVKGETAQGSIAMVQLQNLDFANPFDTTTTGDGFFTPLEYVNIDLLAGDGQDAIVNSVGPYSIDILLLTDVTATAGAIDFEVLSGPLGEQQSFRYPAAFEVTARTATALDPSTTGSVSNPYQSFLFSVDASSLSLVNASAFSDSPDASPAFALLPSSGSFAEMISYGNQTSFVAEETYYLVYWDGTGATGYNFQVEAAQTAATGFAEDDVANDAIETAPAPESFPAVMQTASLTADDADWVKVTLSEAMPGTTIHAFTFGHPGTDPVIELYDDDGETLLGASDDAGFHEDFYSDSLGVGTYYIKIIPSEYFNPSYSDYELAIEVVE